MAGGSVSGKMLTDDVLNLALPTFLMPKFSENPSAGTLSMLETSGIDAIRGFRRSKVVTDAQK